MICPACSEKNRDGARFCTFCGTALALRCGVCDTELISGARFCDACGAAVDQSLEVHEPAAVASRKVVTVLFADLTGSTALEERMDVESVRAILDRFYASMRTEVERHGGRVVKFTGDGLMAAFGVPDVREDDAARAVDTALAMHNELEQLASDLSLDLSLKVGINTGEVVVSETDEDVVGDAVNVASRLEGAATAGQILVGEDTWRLTRGTSRYEPIEPLTLKGKSEPVPAYMLLAVDERTADSAAAPFVGRDAELAKLLRAFEDAVESNACRVVTIIGSPGLGKTRLSRELMSELADVARVRETRCDPAGSAPFEPIADALRAAVGITETDTEADVIEKLTARIDEDDRDRDRIGMRAAAILGVGLAGTTEETFWAVRRLIEAAASTQPVVLVLDDIHWADPLMLDLIEHLAEFIQDAPVLLVGTARPELRDLRPSLVEGGRTATVIALEGLDRTATAQLALNLLGADELPAELLAKIPASTEGNPLFVRELVRMLVDDRVLLRTADGWSVTVDVEAIQVPPTISSLLSARVDRLRNDERTVLELASVVGKEFYRGALKDLVPPPLRDLVDGVLESLRRKELVEPVGTYWIDEPVYRFHHVLIRDAAYRRLLKESRADLHERVADWLERKTEGVLGEHDEVIGYHLEQAVEYKTQLARESGALAQRAAEFLGGAAQRALDRDDLPSAASFSGRALALLPEDEERRAGLLLIRCEAVLSMGDATHGAEAVAEFESLANTPRLRAWATCFSGQLANLTAPERLQETEGFVAAAAADLAELGDLAGAAKAHTVHASTLAALCRFADCEAVLDKALNAARDAGDKRRITAALGSTPHAALWGPNPVSRAGGRCLDIVRLLRITTGSPAVEATSRRCQAVLEAFRGRSDAARGMLRSARRVYTELGLEHELLAAEQFSGIVELVAGDPAAAEEHLRAAHDGFRKVGVDVLAAQSAAMLARAHLLLGEVAEAEACVGTGEELGSQDLKTAIAVRSVRAELLALRGEFDEAKRLAEEAVSLAERTDALIDHGNACRALAAVYRASGDASRARLADDRATALFERKGATALTEGRVASQEAPAPAPQAPAASDLTNRSTRVRDRLLELFATRQWSSFGSVVAENCAFDDRRLGLRHTATGPEGLVESLKPAAESGTARFATVTVAIRGERLSLTRTTARGRGGPAGLETEFHSVQELDVEGRIAAIIDFDPDDLDAALTELDERFALGEAAGFEIARSLDVLRAINKRDWEAVRRFLPENFVVVDRRPASLGTLDGLEAYIQAVGEMQSLIPDLRLYPTAIPLFDHSGGVARMLGSGTTAEGAAVEVEFQTVIVIRDGQFARAEWYPIDQLDTAIARYRELTSERQPGTFIRDNHAAQHLLLAEELINRGDLAGAAALHSAELVRDDRRAGLRSIGTGRDDLFGNLAAIVDGENQLHSTTIATRGERLALVSTHWNLVRGYEVDNLTVVELGPDDLIAQVVFFDADALDAAFAELDDRYLAGEAKSAAALTRLVQSFERIYNRRDWDGLRRLMSDEFVLVDHRLGSLGTLGPDEYVEAMRTLVDLIPGRLGRTSAMPVPTPTACVTTWVATGTTADGALIEDTFHMVWEIRDDRFIRTELYADDGYAEAVARFDELSTATSSMPNRAARVDAELIRTIVVERDLDGYWALCSEDVVVDDRRRGLKHVATGREVLDVVRSGMQMGRVSAHSAVLATRGDRLALTRVLFAGSFDAELIRLCEIDDASLCRRVVLFDADDLGAAFTELDERYLTDEAKPFADVWQRHVDGYAAYNARDWGGLRSTLTDDYVFIDHRPVSLGRLDGADAVIAMYQGGIELAPDVHSRVAVVHEINANGALYENRAAGTFEGSDIEIRFISATIHRDGKMARAEIFPIDQLDAARSRFRELTQVATAGQVNSATRALALVLQRFSEDRLDEIPSLCADDFIRVDRRQGLGHQLDRNGFVESLTQTRALGLTSIGWAPIATRGDRLGLGRIFVTDAAGNGLEFLAISEVDAAGLLTHGAYFDLEDPDGAFAELDERYVSTLDDPSARSFQVLAGFFDAYNTRNWDEAATYYATDIEYIDHRPAGAGTIVGRDAFTRYLKAFVDQAPDVTLRAAEVLGVSGRGEAIMLSGAGHTLDGAEIEVLQYNVMEHRDGLVVRVDIYPLEGRDEALARYTEVTRQRTDVLDNECLRAIRRQWELYAAEDWAGLAEMFEVDHVTDDRRVGLKTQMNGPDAVVHNLKALLAVGGRNVTATPIAVRGEKLVLYRYHVTSADRRPGDFKTEALVVSELGPTGRFASGAVFDPNDLAGAVAELDDRYLAGEGRPNAEVIGSTVSFTRAYTRDDWPRLRELLADDVVFDDHRPVSMPAMGNADEVVRNIRALKELVPGFVMYMTVIHDSTANELFCVMTSSGTTPEGAEVELVFLGVVKVRDGFTTVIDTYALDDFDAAQARFEELLGPQPELENECVRVARAFHAAFEARDWDAMLAGLAEPYLFEDRRAGLGLEITSHEGLVEQMRVLAQIDVAEIPAVVLAIRGEHLALFRHTVHAGDRESSFEVETLVLNESAGDGFAAGIVFDPDDIDAAFRELDERFAAGEGVVNPEFVRASSDFQTAYNARDWDGLGALAADDWIAIDHRPASVGEIHGRDELVAYIKPLIEQAPDMRYEVVSIPALSPHGGVIEVRARGTGPGGPIELRYLSVGDGQGRWHRGDFYPIDRLDLALARFAELGPQPELEARIIPADVPENEASAVLRRIFETGVNEDWTAHERLFAADSVFEDRRRGMGLRLEGRQAVFEGSKVAVQGTAVEWKAVATRGEYLVLCRVTATMREGFEVELLSLHEVNSARERTHCVLFDPDGLDAAIAELDERYIAGEGAAYGAILRAMFDGVRAANEGDWAAVRSSLADDLILTDHRPVALGDVRGADVFIATQKEFLALAYFKAFVRTVPAVATDRILFEMWTPVTTHDGSSYEIGYYVLGQWQGGVTTRAEYFPFDRLDDALARFDELGRDDLAFAPDTIAVRAIRAQYTAPPGGWDESAEFPQFDESSVMEDRRRSMSFRIVGRDANIEHVRASLPGTNLEWTPLAVRGEGLVLCRILAMMRTDFEVELMAVHQFEGPIQRTCIIFEPEDVDEAFAELDAMYIAGEGAPYADLWSCVAALTDAYAKRDWDTFASLISNDLVFVDHRPASLGRIENPADLIRSQKALIDLVPEMHWQFVEIIAIDAVSCVVRMEITTTDTEGGLIEFALYFVLHVRDGKLRNLEFFPLEQRAEALDRHRELSESIPPLENQTTRLLARVLEIALRQDWDALPPLHAPDYRLEDRRAGLQADIVGHDGVIENLKAAAAAGMSDVVRTILATRGERLCLAGMVGRGPADSEFEVELLELTELGEDGRIARGVLLDPDDLDTAYAELDERYAALLPGSEAALVRTNGAMLAAYNARDWQHFGALVAPDFELIDHVPAAVGNVRGRDAYIDYVRSFTELVPNARIESIRDIALGPRAGISESVLRGTSEDGSEVEVTWLDLGQVRGGVVVRLEQFPVDQLDAALARFDELSVIDRSSVLVPIPENIQRRTDEYCAAFARRDWDGLAEFYTEDAVRIDRRAGLGSQIKGRARILEPHREAAALGFTEMRATTLAIRPNLSTLMRVLLVNPNGYEIEFLTLNDVDPDDRIKLRIHFDPADIRAAYEELDLRYLASGEPSDAERLRIATLNAYNARDWARYRSLLLDDIVFVDHQPASLGTIVGADEVIAARRALVDLVPDAHAVTRATLRSEREVELASVWVFGTDNEGANVEYEYLIITQARNGFVGRFESFRPEQLDAAHARFEELISPPPLTLNNLAARAYRRVVALSAEGDWEGVAASVVEDFVIDDRRAGLTWRYEGADALVTNLREVYRSAPALDLDPVAIRGERLVLVNAKADIDGYAVEFPQLFETDSSGKGVAVVMFDDLEEAFAELDERYAADEGRPYAEIFRVCADQATAYGARDWERFRSNLRDDLVFLDHRPAGAGTMSGPDAHIQYLQTMIQLAPDATLRVLEVIAIASDRLVERAQVSGTTDEGAEIELSFLVLYAARRPRIARIEVFPIEEREAALARFAELQPEPLALENGATRQAFRSYEVMATGDWDAAKDLFTEDVVLDDKRRGVGSSGRGSQAWVNNFKAFLELGFTPGPSEVLAVRGDHLALSRGGATDAHGNEMAAIALSEVDAMERASTIVWFDPDDLDTAFDELDKRYLESSEATETDRLMVRFVRARNDRDWSSVRDIASDAVFVDHTVIGLGTLSAPDFVARAESLVELVPDVRIRLVLARDGVFATVAEGLDELGNPVRLENLNVALVHDGRFVRGERFPVEEYDAAAARAAELEG